jgi:hypothetical protein
MRLANKFALFCIVALTSAAADAGFLALESSREAGNQAYTGNLGMDFNVLAPITVTHIGAYDHNEDGIPIEFPITVGIFNRTGTLVAGTQASISSGTSSEIAPFGGNNLFFDIADVSLSIGEYSVVAIGYGGNSPEMNGNAGSGSGSPPSIDSGGGLIEFVGGARFGGTSFGYPGTLDGGPANRYDAGTFIYEAADTAPVPAPMTVGLLGIGLLLLRRNTPV